MRFTRVIIFCLCILIIIGGLLPAYAKDTMVWPYFSYPPLFIVGQKGNLDGIAAGMMRLLWKHLPEYEHRAMLASPRRMIRDLKDGHPMAGIGAFRTSPRDKFLYYSLPCRIGYATMFITSKANLARFGPKPKVSFAELIKDRSLKAGIHAGVSYGQVLDDVLKANPDLPNAIYLSGPSTVEQFIKMIVEKRIDWAAIDPLTASYTARELGVEKELLIGEFREQEGKVDVGYVVVPRNRWGAKAVKKINRALKETILSGEFKKVFHPWVDESVVPEFNRQYHELIYLPAKAAAH